MLHKKPVQVSTNDLNQPTPSSTSDVSNSSTCGNSNRSVHSVGKRIAKTPAERAREYRARKKLLNESEQSVQEHAKNVQISTELSREYRTRKRLANGQAQLNLSQGTTSLDNSMPCVNKRSKIDFRSSTNNESGPRARVKKIPKTAAERARDYRARKKRLWSEFVAQQKLNTPVTSTSAIFVENSFQKSNVPPRINNTSVLNYKGQNVNYNELVTAEERQRKSAAERARAYRARRRFLTENVVLPFTTLTDTEIGDQHLYSGCNRSKGIHNEFNNQKYVIVH